MNMMKIFNKNDNFSNFVTRFKRSQETFRNALLCTATTEYLRNTVHL